jgi:cation:H+ antiporter
MLALAAIAAGIALLAFSGDRLIELASALARKARLTPAVIGLTIVAAGTSTPELFVSVAASLEGSPEIAVANVVGSNSANIGFILGACALLASISVQRRLLQFEYPFMVLASWIFLLLARDGWIDRLEAGFFFVSMIAFTAYSIWVARHEVGAAERDEIAEAVPARAGRLAGASLPVLVSGVAAALVGLAVGAKLLVEGAVHIAASLGMSERVIGLTIVAIGTSLPELVASIAAALKREHEMAVTNIVGSNIFNVLMILGVAGLIRPLPVSPRLVDPDMVVMLAFALLLFPLVARHGTLGRRQGFILLGLYLLYLATVVGG